MEVKPNLSGEGGKVHPTPSDVGSNMFEEDGHLLAEVSSDFEEVIGVVGYIGGGRSSKKVFDPEDPEVLLLRRRKDEEDLEEMASARQKENEMVERIR